MSELIHDVLDDTRQKLLPKLSGFQTLATLGGGTAIALQIGHRRSYDFDLFMIEPIKPDLWKKIRTIIGPGSVKTLDTADQLNITTPESIKITFFYDDYRPVFPNIQSKYLNLMDLRDLASNKAFVIGKRGKWRDYVDLFFLLKSGKTTIQEIIDVSQKRSNQEFPTRLFLEQLTYFDDINDYLIDYIESPIEPETIKHFLIETVKTYHEKSIK